LDFYTNLYFWHGYNTIDHPKLSYYLLFNLSSWYLCAAQLIANGKEKDREENREESESTKS